MGIVGELQRECERLREFMAQFEEAGQRAIVGCDVDVDFDLEDPSGRCVMCEKRELCELLIEVKEYKEGT